MLCDTYRLLLSVRTGPPSKARGSWGPCGERMADCWTRSQSYLPPQVNPKASDPDGAQHLMHTLVACYRYIAKLPRRRKPNDFATFLRLPTSPQTSCRFVARCQDLPI